jgi:hypothetical protein
MDVTAIDNSPMAIDVCKERGVKRPLLLPLENLDRLKERFDTIVMFCNNFGLFSNRKKARLLLKELHAMTSEKAVFLAASMDPHDTKDSVHLDYHRRNVRRGRMPGQLHARVRYSIYKSGWFDYLLVSADEMAKLLEGTGWKIREILRSDGSTYIAVLNKVATMQ